MLQFVNAKLVQITQKNYGVFVGDISLLTMVYIIPICEPGCWYIYLQNWMICWTNVGKSSSTMVRIWGNDQTLETCAHVKS